MSYLDSLPEPDSHADGEDEHGNETSAAQWEINHLHWVYGIITAWTNGIEIEGVFHDEDDGIIELIEGDALKVLAAIAEQSQVRLSGSGGIRKVTR